MLTQKNNISLRLMKKITRIKVFTFTAMLLVFVLQAMWLYRAYMETKARLYLEINDDFSIAVEEELTSRFRSYNEVATPVSSDNQSSDPYVLFDSKSTPLRNENPGEDFIITMQEYLLSQKQFLSLDSIGIKFSDLLSKNKIQGKFIINHIDIESGAILETSDNEFNGSIESALYSDIIPVRLDKSEGVQVLLVFPHRTIFLQMTLILILSLLLIVFVVSSIFYQLNSLIKEKHLRKLHTDFAHALTHDMATPLQTITGVINMLNNKNIYDNQEKRANFVEIGLQQTLNLQALTERILTIAKAEESKLVITLLTVNLKEIILQLIGKFDIQSKKPVEFEVSFSHEEMTMEADATLLTNAISNLIDNAIKYSGNTVRIEIQCEKKMNGIFISIKDNGNGIAEKDMDKVFTMYERGKALLSKDTKGFGIGLSYVKSVVEAHGGAINLTSKENEGSNFILYFNTKQND